MEKLSGLILDVYDDFKGDVLRSIFPTNDAVPAIIKEAQYLPPEQMLAQPDDLFALILRDGDVVLRKYACVDAGNTALSVEYFMQNGHKLPAEAQKTAAENLVTACGWYSLEPPEELKKVAFGALLGKAMGSLGRGALSAGKWVAAKPLERGLPLVMGVMGAGAAAGQIKGNLQEVKAHEAQQGFGNIGHIGGL